MKIHDMLTDRKTYSDDVEITAPNGEKVKLGDFREAFFAREAELNTKAGEIQANAKLLDAGRQELTKVYQEMSTREAALLAREAEFEKLQKSHGSDVANVYEDKYIKPLVDELRTISEMNKALTARLETAEKNQVAISRTGLERFWEMDFARIKEDMGKDVFPEDLTSEKLAGYAWTNGFKTPDGQPDLRRAAKEIASPKLIEKARTEGKELGLKEAREDFDRRALLGSSSGFIPRSAPDGVTVFDRSKGSILKQAVAASAKDPVIWSSGN